MVCLGNRGHSVIFETALMYRIADSLQHRTPLSPPDTSSDRHCFCFGSASSFLLELISLLFSSNILDIYQPAGVHLLVSYLFPFSYSSWSSQGNNAEVVCHAVLQWNTFYRTLHHNPSILALHGMAHSFIELES